MAQSVVLKRSGTASKVPLITDLSLGEMAINTFDGKVYIKKDNGTESIVDVTAGGGISDAPSDGTSYVRKDATWVAEGSSVALVDFEDDIQTAGASQVTFTTTAYILGNVDVFINGTLMQGGGVDYTETNTTTITLSAGATAGWSVTIRKYGNTPIPNTIVELSDTTITTPSDGDILMYNSTSTNWENVSRNSLTPTLSGNASGTESTTLDITITNYASYSAGAIFTISVESGTFERTGDTITWTLPAFTGTDDSHNISVQAGEAGELISSVGTHTVGVLELTIVADTAILFENTTISATEFPTVTNVDLTSNTLLATADSASATSYKVEQDVGDGDFVNAIPTVDNTAINYNIDIVNMFSTSATDPFGDSSLLAKYEFENNVLATVGNNGTPTNITYEAGNFGQRAIFNTSTVTYTAVTGMKSISLFASATALTSNQAIVGATDDSWFGFSASGAGFMQISVNGGIGVTFTLLSNNVINQEYHFCLVWTSQTSLVLYRDGILQDTLTVANYQTLGYSIFGNRSDSALPFIGTLDQLEIYNRALTVDEITSLYNQKTFPFLTLSGHTVELGGLDGATNVSTTDAVEQHSTNVGTNGTASASSIYDGTYDAWKAFNNLLGGTDAWLTVLNTTTGYLQYTFNTGKVINKYIMKPDTASTDTQVPKDWTFRGSTDNFVSVDDVLDTVTGHTEAKTVEYTGTFSNSTAYTSYRIDITANNGATNYTAIGELELIEDVRTPVPADTLLLNDGASTTLQEFSTSGTTTLGFNPDGTINTSTTDSTQVLTGYTGGGDTIIASTEWGAGYEAWRACDGVLTGEGWITNNITSGWLKYQFGTAKTINKYTIIGNIDLTTASPKDWTLQGSNDDTNWDVLDTVTGETGWDATKRTFTCSNDTAYTYYKIDITAANGPSYTGIGELELIEAIDIIATVDLTTANLTSAPTIVAKDVSEISTSLTTGAIADGSTNTSTTDATETHTTFIGTNGTVSASSEFSTTYSPWKAFADDGSTSFWVANAGTGWIQYEFNTAKVINKIIIFPRSGAVQDSPSDFTIEASNTGAFAGEEVVLKTLVNYNDWVDGVGDVFTFINDTTYTHYRIDITDADSSLNIGIGEIEFVEAEHVADNFVARTAQSYTSDAAQTVADGASNSSTLDAVPVMTSATTPSGAASQSTLYVTDYAWQLFDGVNNTYGTCGTTTGWFQYQFAATTPINKYTLRSQIGLPTRAPNSWTIEASNTGAFAGEEVVLDTVTAQTSWDDTVPRTFTFTNGTPYTYYRMDITANNGASYVGFAEWELIAAETPTKITTVYDTDTRSGRDFKVKVDLADSGDEVTRISIPIDKEA